MFVFYLYFFKATRLYCILPWENNLLEDITKQERYRCFTKTNLITNDNKIFGTKRKLRFEQNLKFEEIYMAMEFSKNMNREVTSEEGSSCPVCMCDYEEEHMRKLNCSHFICQECHPRLANKCPTCRSYLRFSNTMEMLLAYEDSASTYFFE